MSEQDAKRALPAGRRGERIRSALVKAFSTHMVRVRDDSHKHIGPEHAGSGKESHFSVEITAQVFSGRTRVERHRMVYEALEHFLRGSVHAVRISARVPDEEESESAPSVAATAHARNRDSAE